MHVMLVDLLKDLFRVEQPWELWYLEDEEFWNSRCFAVFSNYSLFASFAYLTINYFPQFCLTEFKNPQVIIKEDCVMVYNTVSLKHSILSEKLFCIQENLVFEFWSCWWVFSNANKKKMIFYCMSSCRNPSSGRYLIFNSSLSGNSSWLHCDWKEVSGERKQYVATKRETTS